jgi:hypothetical protein
MRSDTGEGDDMSATAAETGADAPDARRQALFVLLRAELAAARSRLLACGGSPRAVSQALDERISILSADCPLAGDRRTRSPHGRRDPDDVQGLGDDPIERGGLGQ